MSRVANGNGLPGRLIVSAVRPHQVFRLGTRESLQQAIVSQRNCTVSWTELSTGQQRELLRKRCTRITRENIKWTKTSSWAFTKQRAALLVCCIHIINRFPIRRQRSSGSLRLLLTRSSGDSGRIPKAPGQQWLVPVCAQYVGTLKKLQTVRSGKRKCMLARAV